MMDSDSVDYVFNYFGQLMTEKEAKAWRHYSSEYKLTDGGEKEPSAIRKNMYLKNGWLSQDAEILQLLDSGFETFNPENSDEFSDYCLMIFQNTGYQFVITSKIENENLIFSPNMSWSILKIIRVNPDITYLK